MSTTQVLITEFAFVPRIGDKIDIFYHPFPVVTSVLLYPSDETLSSLASQQFTDLREIVAVVTVS